MKTNIEIKDPRFECECGGDVEPYDTEMIDPGEEEITIKFCGWCPQCKKEYTWRSQYKFISGVITSTEDR